MELCDIDSNVFLGLLEFPGHEEDYAECKNECATMSPFSGLVRDIAPICRLSVPRNITINV